MVFAGIFLLTTMVLGAAVTGLVYGVSDHLEADDVRPDVIRPNVAAAGARRPPARASSRPLGGPTPVRARRRQASLGTIG